jgi:hypothetical protein
MSGLPADDRDELDQLGGSSEGGAGRFTAAGRRAALNNSLPLMATYFADAPTWDLEVTRQISSSMSGDPVLDDLAAGARLRASLAAADRLLGILADVAARPTFRYTRVAAESVGTIAGRLDLSRFSRQLGRVTVPRRYPIRLVERENATPENVLAAYATLWIKRDLEAAPVNLLPRGSPELRELQQASYSLARTVGLPLLAGTAAKADDIWRRSGLTDLLDRVTQRVEAGHVARPEPYLELVKWVTATRLGDPVAAVGDREWSFYDERFDTKLFEIWCLVQLAAAITALVGVPNSPPPSLARRGAGPLYTWDIGAGDLRLHFQPSLGTLGTGRVAWSYRPGPGDLQGFPDLAVTVDTVAGHGLALFDPKLRRRSGAPTEEIYKLLGYFANLRHDRAPVGAILYYSPAHATDYALISDRGGEIHALGLGPEQPSGQLFAIAANLALKAGGLGDTAIGLLSKSGTSDAKHR